MGEKDHSTSSSPGRGELTYVPLEAIRRVRADTTAIRSRARELLADLCRINTLYMIMQAGSGHIGSSFSSLDLITWLWTACARRSQQRRAGRRHLFLVEGPRRAGALFAAHRAREARLRSAAPAPPVRRAAGPSRRRDAVHRRQHRLARHGHLEGLRHGPREASDRTAAAAIVVMTGDGELQEGQIWESLQPAANERLAEIIVVVDHNKLQSDSAVSAVSDLGPIEDKFRAFGWEVRRADGHDLARRSRRLRDVRARRPTGRRCSSPTRSRARACRSWKALACGDQTYHFHAGAPTLKDYLAAVDEITARVNGRLAALTQPAVALDHAPLPARSRRRSPNGLSLAYGDELLQMARTRHDIVVLDADLLSDCGIEAFKAELPERFIECGIAEQHMVSAAGGMALQGLLPVVHSFACFLSTRANEHIYNNATERRKIIYTATLAGAIPGGPGHSHQSVRDISAIGAVPA